MSFSHFANGSAGGWRRKKAETRSLAHEPHTVAARLAAKRALKRPPVSFTGVQALAVGNGFHEYVRKSGLVVWACAILPEHTHLVVGRYSSTVEQVVIQLKGNATRRLCEENRHPFAHLAGPGKRPPKCFARG